MIGEQALIETLLGRSGVRTADVVATEDLKVVSLNAALQERLAPGAKAVWSATLAAVVNEKLEQATRQRADFRDAVSSRNALLARFADKDALGIVRRAIEEGHLPVVARDVLIWFSNIADFSVWSRLQAPEEIARIARGLSALKPAHTRSR